MAIHDNRIPFKNGTFHWKHVHLPLQVRKLSSLPKCSLCGTCPGILALGRLGLKPQTQPHRTHARSLPVENFQWHQIPHCSVKAVLPHAWVLSNYQSLGQGRGQRDQPPRSENSLWSQELTVLDRSPLTPLHSSLSFDSSRSMDSQHPRQSDWLQVDPLPLSSVSSV